MAEYHRLVFDCAVPAAFEKVISGFDINLFRVLCPAFPKVRIIRFDGIAEGDLVELSLDLFLVKWQWSGKVISFNQTEDELRFVDSGLKLPPFLGSWRHTHIVKRSGSGSFIIDEISFSPAPGWPAFLVKWMIRMQMQPRKKIYRKYFAS
jgi:ligand-binding SRPBCC domain-containing protein